MSTNSESYNEKISTSKFSRRHFIKGAAATGVGAGLLGLAACGGDDAATSDSADAVVQGGTLRVAIGKIANAPTPFSTNDAGSLQILANVGEYLSWSNEKGELVPRVAESWKASEGGKVWTFKIREGITFHDGSPLTADDVVWTFTSHLDAANESTGR